MKLLCVSWLILLVCGLGRCDMEAPTHQVFATDGGGENGDDSDEVPDPLRQSYWNNELKDKKKYGDAFAQSQIKGYFAKYAGRKLTQVQAGSRPENIIDQQILGLDKKGKQICLYRCMDEFEAEQMKIDLVTHAAVEPCYLAMQYLKGHLGHVDQASHYCRPDQAGEPKVLIEFVLKPDAHKVLFSPQVAALGTEAKSTAVIAELALKKGQGKYVVKATSEGFVQGFIGIKSEKDYFSLAMQANHGEVRDNPTKRLLSKLTAHIRAIEPDTKAKCEIVMPKPTSKPDTISKPDPV